MKRMLFVYILLLCFGICGSAIAANDMSLIFDGTSYGNYGGSIILSPDTDKALVDGEVKKLYKPIVRDGRIWLPLRSIAEVFGCQVNFTNGEIEIINNDDILKMNVEMADVILNGKAIRLSNIPYVENGVTWLPMRAIGEVLHKQVDWENAYQDYSSEVNYLPHNLIFIYDAGSNFPTKNNTPGINHFYDCCLALLHNERDIVFANKYITVYRDEGQVYLCDSYYHGAESQILNDGSLPVNNVGNLSDVLDKGDGFVNAASVWIDTNDGWLLCRNECVGWDLRGRTVLYYLDSKDLREARWCCLAEEVNFAAIQIVGNGVLTLRHFTDEDVWDYNETNLVYYDFAEKQKVVLGTSGYFYGFDLQGNCQSWKIENDEIVIYGYDRRMEISEEQRNGSYMQYKLQIPM